MTTTQIVERHIHRRLRGHAGPSAGGLAGRAVKWLAVLAGVLVLGACARELLGLVLAGALVVSLGLP
jgi:hypothetical protein